MVPYWPESSFLGGVRRRELGSAVETLGCFKTNLRIWHICCAFTLQRIPGCLISFVLWSSDGMPWFGNTVVGFLQLRAEVLLAHWELFANRRLCNADSFALWSCWSGDFGLVITYQVQVNATKTDLNVFSHLFKEKQTHTSKKTLPWLNTELQRCICLVLHVRTSQRQTVPTADLAVGTWAYEVGLGTAFPRDLLGVGKALPKWPGAELLPLCSRL